MDSTIWDIDCPFCEKRMMMRTQDASINHRTGQHYIRTRYVCVFCDYWLKTEIPRRIAMQHARVPLPEPVKEAVEENG